MIKTKHAVKLVQLAVRGGSRIASSTEMIHFVLLVTLSERSCISGDHLLPRKTNANS